MLTDLLKWPSALFYSCLLLIYTPLLWATNSPMTTIEHNNFMRLQYIKAIKASQSDELGLYQQYVNTLKQYPLLPYLQYSHLTEHFDSINNQDVDNFLQLYGDTIIGNKLRYIWLMQAVKEKNWQRFKAFDSGSVENDEIDCARALANNDSHPKTITRLWLRFSNNPVSCQILYSHWLQYGVINEDLVWQRFIGLLSSNQNDRAEQLFFFLNQQDQQYGATLLNAAKNSGHETAVIDYLALAVADEKYSAFGIKKLAEHSPILAIELYPNLRIAEQEQEITQFYLAWHLAEHSPEKAYQWLQATNEKAASTQLIGYKIRLALSTNNWPRVEQHIQQLPASEQQTPRWQYWLLRSRQKMLPLQPKQWQAGYVALSQQRNYYGLLAAYRAGKNLNFNQQTPVTNEPLLTGHGLLQLSPPLRRAAELSFFGAEELAALEWRQGIDGLTTQQVLSAAQTAADNGDYRRSIETIIQAKLWDYLGLRFPRHYQAEVAKTSRLFNLEQPWLFALIRQESLFDANALSANGAVGLLQLYLPKLAKSNSLLQQAVLTDPETNLYLGGTQLEQLLDKYQQNYPLAAIAYHLGTQPVERWLRNAEEIADVDQWIETIPHKKYRRYTQNIITFSAIYGHLIGSNIDLSVAMIMPEKPAEASLNETTAKATTPR
ncbi:transglycosylase SLT domain-containing protein [Sinobacterium norvegicum]|uniref:transglycosylase SLT domain-containing protein n=1 Tax=Sinobacterium norvegicum TaxID=1641715 RepID=UPI001F47CCDD|nr:transglycosylase SLT domain-containing protein [Sinobacterium norvegicum]